MLGLSLSKLRQRFLGRRADLLVVIRQQALQRLDGTPVAKFPQCRGSMPPHEELDIPQRGDQGLDGPFVAELA